MRTTGKGALMTDEDIPLCVDRALCMAAWEGHTETVRALLDAGADVHAWTDAPLWEAAMKGHADTMRALLDAGAHILSGRFKETPAEYADVVPRLAARGVLDAALAERLAQVSGFRNLLVHEYAAVDFGLVHDKLQRLDDLLAFAAALERWLAAQGL